MVSALESGSGFELWPGHSVVFLGKTLTLIGLVIGLHHLVGCLDIGVR